MTSSSVPPIYSAQIVTLVHYTNEWSLMYIFINFLFIAWLPIFSHIVSCDEMSCPGALEVVYASVVVMCKVLNGVNCSLFPCRHIYMYIDILHAFRSDITLVLIKWVHWCITLSRSPTFHPSSLSTLFIPVPINFIYVRKSAVHPKTF